MTDGSGSLPVQFAQPQKMEVEELSRPEHAPISRMLKYCDAMPAAIMDIIMVDQFSVSIVENTRPRKRSSSCLRSFDQFKTELIATLPRETAINSSAIGQLRIWLNTI